MSEQESSDAEVRFRAAEAIADIDPKDIPKSAEDSLEYRNILSAMLADAVIAIKRHEEQHGEILDYSTPETMIQVLGGEEEARKKYGDHVVDLLLQGE